MLVRPTVLGFNPALKPYPYDPARAKQLIAEAKAAGVPVDAPLTLLARRGGLLPDRGGRRGDRPTCCSRSGLTNLKTQVLEIAKHTEIYSGAEADRPGARHHRRPQPRQRAAGLRPDGAVLLHLRGRQSTYCDPVVDEMQNKALPLTGAEREKAYQAIGKYDLRRVRHDPDRHPSFYYAHEPAAGLDAAARRVHPGQGDEAQGVGVPSARWRFP